MGKRGRPRKVKFELERDAAHSIAAVAILALSILTLLSFFGQAAGFGSMLQKLLNRVFGWGAFLVPFILALSSLILFRKLKWKIIQPRILTGLVLFLLSFDGTVHFFFSPAVAKEEALMGQGGGMLGYIIQKYLRTFLGPFGAILILASFLLVSVLVIFNASLDETLVFLGNVLSGIGRFFENFVFRGTLKVVRKLIGREDDLEAEVVEGKEGSSELSYVGDDDEESEGEVEEEKQVEKVRRDDLVVVQATYTPLGVEEDSEDVGEDVEKAPLRHETVANLPESKKEWEYPPLSILEDIPPYKKDQEEMKDEAQKIEDTLESFGIKANVADVKIGPTVTQYALEAASGTKLTKITTLHKDLAMALASSTGSVRIEAPIPGKSLVGIEVPNKKPATVGLKSVLTSEAMKKSSSVLSVALGKNVSGRPQVADLARMPHVLIAGATGSGKSVLIHSFICSLLFRTTPEEVRLILADPKRVELSIYREIPHLLTPVILDSDKMLPTLDWAVEEMERRYKLFQDAGAKDIDSYNEISGFQALPKIVLVVDELADLMAAAANEVEKAVVRLAQMSRATGVHLVLSTQRPSTDVLTGLIKANIPCRIALNTTSGVDSRVIIDQPGADKLLGRGDMLYLPPEASTPKRIQAPFISLIEIKALVDFLREEMEEEPEFEESLQEAQEKISQRNKLAEEENLEGLSDELFPDAVEVVCRHDRGSASLLQRKLSIGYARAARLLDALEAKGVVGPKDGSKPRELLVSDPSEVL
ncbi:MAG: DNA translocase FtsK 4TM domain-containing protein [Patescibacteria group bacterium]|nr:DNA translocase FtsK 4TM domain-containing protein [Patescibacteria group bacterium]